MKEITDVLVECAHYARSGNIEATTLDELRSSLKSIFSVLTDLFAANSRDKGWVSDSKPGYLARKIVQGGETLEIRIPWTILAGFPRDEVLAELLGLAQRIRSGEDTSICLSGSAAVHSVFRTVGDLDFCEYIEVPSSLISPELDRSFARTLKISLEQEAPELLCLRIHILATGLPPPEDHKDLRRPWSVPLDKDSRLVTLAQKARAGKCDFIAQTSLLGTVEVTNLVLLVDPTNPDEGTGAWSSPYQEAPIGAWVPRSLAEPLVMGNYINRLRKEAEQHLEAGKLGKAAKRLYAMATALFLGELGNKLLTLFDKNAQELLVSSTLLARLDLRRRIRQNADPAVLAFETPLSQTLAQLVREADRLDLPGISGGEEAPAEWYEETEQRLNSLSKRNDSIRTELSSILEEMAGLL
jgi:hypothetical protein